MNSQKCAATLHFQKSIKKNKAKFLIFILLKNPSVQIDTETHRQPVILFIDYTSFGSW